jgi:hypothetical protein
MVLFRRFSIGLATVQGKSWSFLEGLAFSIGLSIQSCKKIKRLERPICEVEKVKSTDSHTRLGLNPQIGRPLSRIVVPLFNFFLPLG